MAPSDKDTRFKQNNIASSKSRAFNDYVGSPVVASAKRHSYDKKNIAATTKHFPPAAIE